MRRPAPWASNVAARGTSIALKARAPACSRRAWSSGSSGRGKGKRVEGTKGNRGPGNVKPFPEAHVGELPRGKQRIHKPRPQRLPGPVDAPVGGEQGPPPPAGGLDECGQLLD